MRAATAEEVYIKLQTNDIVEDDEIEELLVDTPWSVHLTNILTGCTTADSAPIRYTLDRPTNGEYEKASQRVLQAFRS